MSQYRKKLIEVALPLEAINKASAREKSIRHGHPSTLHLWWSRKPLSTARAVLFAQLVDDPSDFPDLFPTEKAQEKERQRLFRILEDLASWENTSNDRVLQQARDEIWQSWRRACAEHADHPRARELFDRNRLPEFHDPFAGGGAIPLEAQRLGLRSHASDLNPVAVLINKAMIEIPPKFAGRPAVNPKARQLATFLSHEWKGAQGLADDVRFFGQWMRDEAEKRLGHLYPKVAVTSEMAADRPDLLPYVGQKLTVVVWLWARTVKSPNPAFAHLDVPLTSTFMLSSKLGKEAFVEPLIENDGYRFRVKVGKPADLDAAKRGTKLSRGANFRCIMSGTPISSQHIYAEARAGRMGARLMAIVAEGENGRVYLPPIAEMEDLAKQATPTWKPDLLMPQNPRWFSPPLYGLTAYGDLFTARQLVSLATFADLVQEAREYVKRKAVEAGLLDDGKALVAGGSGASAYADAVAVYLAFCVDKMTDTNTALCSWQVDPPRLRSTFGRQAIPMMWENAEANIFGDAAGDFRRCVQSLTEVLDRHASTGIGVAEQADAQTLVAGAPRVFSFDPPYYDNIGYADLSDFFYVWLRRSLRSVFPDLFVTLAVPKAEELVATPYRHGSKESAESFFLNGMTQAMKRIGTQSHPAYPVTIYYAFKQAESDSDDGTASTGWETFLDAVIRAGFAISGTWPMRSELATRNVGRGTNALASSIVLVCRPQPENAPTASRRQFVSVLKTELPLALSYLQRSNIAPVDLAQAAIGPGMAVFTRYSQVLDADGNRVSVREALALINQTLDEILAEQDGEFDADSRWALAWFEQVGFADGEYGVAETLSKAKNTSVQGMVEAGVVVSRRGKVRLLRPDELDAKWDPATDKRLTAWEVTHQLVRVLEEGGEGEASSLVQRLGTGAEVARDLAYRLYTICERKKRPTEALSYNGLVQSWPEITRLALEGGKARPAQPTFFDSEEE